jgi:Holliday junction resolvase RusA-like endonuclease
LDADVSALHASRGQQEVAFTVPGEPQGKGRPRVGRVAGHARMFTPAKTVAYEGLVAHAAHEAMAGHPPFAVACVLELDVVCSVAASWSGRKRAQALAGEIRPTKKPDADNVLKAVCDGMNGVVWNDDVQAVDVVLRKRYGATPGVHVRVAVLGAEVGAGAGRD